MAGPPSAKTLIDVIVLVFSKSELKSLVGTDALKTVLEGEQRALFPDPGTMHLQPVYDLLESQPGFDNDKAAAPFCRLKIWELQLKTKIVMPVAFAGLDTKTCEHKSMNVNAFDSDLEKLIAPTTKPSVAMPRMIESGSADTKVTEGEKASRRFKIAAATAGLAVVAAGVSIFLTLRGGGDSGNTQRFSGKELSEVVPLDKVKQSGTAIMATLADANWMKKPEAERREQLAAVVDKLRARNARMLTILEPGGRTIGTVVVKDPPIISFTKPPAPKK